VRIRHDALGPRRPPQTADAGTWFAGSRAPRERTPASPHGTDVSTESDLLDGGRLR